MYIYGTEWGKPKITINVPVVYMVRDVVTLRRWNPFRGGVGGGVGPGIETFLGPGKSPEPSGEGDLGPKSPSPSPEPSGEGDLGP